MSKIAKGLIVVLFMAMGWMSSAHAAPAWYRCGVNMAGMPDTNILFGRFSHLDSTPAFVNKAFVATSDNAKQMFAAALVGMSADTPVWIFADPDAGDPGQLFFIYVAKEN